MKILKAFVFGGWLAFVYHMFDLYMGMMARASSPEDLHRLSSHLGIFMFGDVLITIYLFYSFWLRKEDTKT